MFLTANSSRSLVVAVMRLDGRYYNWQSEGWETPFDASKHTVAFKVIDPTKPFNTIQLADVGDILMDYRDVIPVVMEVDPTTGAPKAITDVWPLPNPVPQPIAGGYAFK